MTSRSTSSGLVFSTNAFSVETMHCENAECVLPLKVSCRKAKSSHSTLSSCSVPAQGRTRRKFDKSTPSDFEAPLISCCRTYDFRLSKAELKRWDRWSCDPGGSTSLLIASLASSTSTPNNRSFAGVPETIHLRSAVTKVVATLTALEEEEENSCPSSMMMRRK